MLHGLKMKRANGYAFILLSPRSEQVMNKFLSQAVRNTYATGQ
jgi:hypothetical protein